MARILVVEDDRDHGLLMQMVLKRSGHDVCLVADGRDALERCVQEAPDLVLLDVTIPGMDGYELARQLKSQEGTADIPIVFVTGSTEPHQRIAGLNVGANDYIAKPFHREELLARVEVALRIKREADELRAAMVRLAELSVTDSLTGLYNRRHLDQRLGEEVARAHRHSLPLTCMMVDLDRFKGVNDRYGHQEGDRVLQAVAEVLRRSTRLSDVVGRYGGEEFTVLAPATDLASAMTLAERIRSAVERRGMRLAGEVVRTTVSIGVAQLAPDGSGRTLLADADRALYAAKAAGRNRVVAAGQA